MKVGVFFLMDELRGRPERETFDEVLRQAVLAEELGFDGVWLAEHQFDADYGRCPSPLMMAVRIAEHTKRIRIGTAVVVLPLTHPLRVAGEAALCDVLSGGRLDLGLGSGYAPYEFASFGIPLEERRARLSEGLDVLAGVWRHERFAYQGTYYQFPEVSIFPRPLQQPHPPIWIAAISRETATLAGRQGFHVLQTAGAGSDPAALRANFAAVEDAWREHGHPGRPERGLNRFVFVTDGGDAAVRQAGEPMVAFVQRNVRYFGHASELKPEDVTLDRLLRDRVLTLGDPDTCLADLRRLQSEVGLTYLVCRTRFRGVPAALVERSMWLFAEHVLPALRATAAAAVAPGQRAS